MARSSKSQWDFGELFPPASTRKVLSVSDLTTQIKRQLEKGFTSIWVSGEISNFRLQSSGHAYFVLKDAGAQLQCVLFRGQAGVDRNLLRDGAHVLLGGEITVYEPRGQYQLRVSSAELQGIGALQAAFERLKQKLNAEGLFDPDRKRPIPTYPARIGLVTSPTGAAIRDVLHVIQRRNPKLAIILAPSRVQGEGSAADVVRALAMLNRWSERQPVGRGLDLILVTRGGGSLEDLWTFNEESVARAIAASALPVVSAVGHEIDFTIADFVADLRAATPSAAAEIITASFVASREFVESASERIANRARLRLDRWIDELSDWQRRLARAHPRRQIERNSQLLDDLQSGLSRNSARLLRNRKGGLEQSVRRLSTLRPSAVLARHVERLSALTRRLSTGANQQLKSIRQRANHSQTRLELLSPQNVLNRGYSITQDAATGTVVRDAEQVRPGQVLRTRVQHGEVTSMVSERPTP